MNAFKILITVSCLIAAFFMSISVVRAGESQNFNVINPPETESKITEIVETAPTETTILSETTINEVEITKIVETSAAKTDAPSTESSEGKTEKSTESTLITTTAPVTEPTVTTTTVNIEPVTPTYDYKDALYNCLIIGDSLVTDIIHCNIVPENNIFSMDGPITIKGSKPLTDVISSAKPARLYIMIGKDYLSSKDTIAEVNHLHKANPSSIIYVVGVPNISNSTVVDDYNNALKTKTINAGYKFIMPDEVTKDMISDDGTTLNEYGFSKLLDKFIA